MTLLPAVLLIVGALALISGRFGTHLSIMIAHRRAILSHANERTSHTLPTPRLGGIGLALGVAVPACVLLLARKLMPEDVSGPIIYSFAQLPARALLGAAVCCAIAFAVGLADDMFDLKPVPKLSGQCLAALAAALGGLHPRFTESLPAANLAGAAFAFFFVLLMINVINFVDGIDGLAGRLCQIPFLAMLLAIPVDRPAGLAAIVACVIVLLAIEGFLGLNESNPKTFMGDSGSHFLGALVAVSLLLADNANVLTKVSPIALLALIAVPTFDVLQTLARRASEGESLFKAHRGHLYQRHLVATGERHLRTRLFVLAHAAAGGIVGGMLMFNPAYNSGKPFIAAGGAVVLIVASYFAQILHAERRARA